MANGVIIPDNQATRDINNRLSNVFSTVPSKNGNFSQIVKSEQVWVIICQRVSVFSTIMLVVNNYGGMQVKEIVKDSGFTYSTDADGTVSILYNGVSTGVWGSAYRIA